ncbi:12587_t:CDS:2 [Acaulospora colombiana]|uniref:12587_t:CDS:1 n=1 Tax=Acaulospora colombiana TaxID=27376 RepID=A0ACA9NXU3_9GLOM|nr:12587_t:CDS:2 [Acaulospora colombiana]
MSVTRSSTSSGPAGRNDAAGPQPTNSNSSSDASGHPTSTTSSTIPTPDSPNGLEHDNFPPNGSTTPPRDGQHSHTSPSQTAHSTTPLSPNGTTDPSLVHDPPGTNESFPSSIDGSPNGSNASAGSSTAAVGGDGSSPMELVDDDIGGALDIETGDEYSGEDYMQDLRRVKGKSRSGKR